MADHAHSPEEASHGSMASSASTRSPSSGAFISNSRNFTISGGNITNITNIVNNTPIVTSDFRTIQLGDLDLRNEIRLEHLGVGKQSDMTVAVYQGENAEETWKREVSKYSGIRHPNFVQLYASVNSDGLYATIFHDDLVPLKQFVDEYRHSVISTVYLYSFFHAELDLRGQSLSWIRRSTGRLCLEIAPDIADRALPYLIGSSMSSRFPLSSLGPDPEMSMISSLTLNQFHNICCWYLARTELIPTLDKIHLGAIVLLHGESIRELGYIPNVTFSDDGWRGPWHDNAQIMPTHMENGWSRFHSSSVNGVINQTIWRDADRSSWLSQANYIFSQLATPPKHEYYILIDYIEYQLSFSGPSENLPQGYLFLCPLEDLQDDVGNFLRNLDCVGYWSLNPAGSQRLSSEEASSLGFPPLNLETYVYSRSWTENFYTALSRFHAGKGFDANSQDLARHLGYALYELSCSPGADSAHIEEVTSEVCEDPASTSLHALQTPRFRAKLRSLEHRMLRTLKIRN
ncbi:hypothetical protein C8R44DRAFT_860239 [Mycena epipterygia]|nr:hypothetical protein C8R44DRAFT_860239 [Mycena epipterygia]